MTTRGTPMHMRGEWHTHCQHCGAKLPTAVYRRNFTPWAKCPHGTGCCTRRKGELHHPQRRTNPRQESDRAD